MIFRYRNVCVESLGVTIPEEIVTSSEIEHRLQPLYERLRLPEGRLELMTGIRERRIWAKNELPSEMSIRSGDKAIRSSGIDRSRIGVLIHGSVCRDRLEPATACRTHHHLGLPESCLIYDVSNACLGLMSGVIQAANMIELGQTEAGLVVGTESSRDLLETTIQHLNENHSLTRNDIKLAIASLTIGSGSCAILVTSAELSKTKNRVVGAVSRAHTIHHRLCEGTRDEGAEGGMAPTMSTDSEVLMREGIAVGQATFEELLQATQWRREEITRTCCHQVGATHRKLMLESLGLPIENDFETLSWLGNTGSVAVGLTLAKAIEAGFVASGHQLAMLGIGSGINSVMLGIDWRQSPSLLPA